MRVLNLDPTLVDDNGNLRLGDKVAPTIPNTIQFRQIQAGHLPALISNLTKNTLEHRDNWAYAMRSLDTMEISLLPEDTVYHIIQDNLCMGVIKGIGPYRSSNEHSLIFTRMKVGNGHLARASVDFLLTRSEIETATLIAAGGYSVVRKGDFTEGDAVAIVRVPCSAVFKDPCTGCTYSCRTGKEIDAKGYLYRYRISVQDFVNDAIQRG